MKRLREYVEKWIYSEAEPDNKFCLAIFLLLLKPLLVHKRALDQVVAAYACFRGNGQTEIVQNFAGVFQHGRAAAQHGAVVLRVDFGQADVFKQFAAYHQVGQAAVVFVVFAGNDRVVNQFFFNQVAEVFVFGQFFGEAVVVRQIFFVAHAVYEDDFFKLLVNFGVFGDAQERGDAGTSAQQVKVFAGIQVAGNQSSGRFFAD